MVASHIKSAIKTSIALLMASYETIPSTASSWPIFLSTPLTNHVLSCVELALRRSNDAIYDVNNRYDSSGLNLSHKYAHVEYWWRDKTLSQYSFSSIFHAYHGKWYIKSDIFFFQYCGLSEIEFNEERALFMNASIRNLLFCYSRNYMFYFSDVNWNGGFQQKIHFGLLCQPSG